jgi:pimeloyl-ACP methyl ester carboxylesterase
MLRRILLAMSMIALAAQPVAAQPIERKVAAATRLDWEFAARGFPSKDQALPAGFDSTRQKYRLFVPKTYDKDKPGSLVLFISAGEFPAGWKSWQKHCEEHNVFFASPFAAGNTTPAGPRVRIVLDVLDDVRRAYKIDPDQTYLVGFSGGGRMACAIAFALPELFGGVVPLCGTNPLSGPTYQRHLIEDRLSVAFVTGEKDDNRKENEEYMAPWFQEAGIRAKLFMMPGAGHTVPTGVMITDIHAWLAQDLDRRRAYRKAHPKLVVGVDEAPTAAEQSARWFDAAQADLADPDRVWRGVSLLQGIASRWPKSDAAAQARSALKKVAGDTQLLARVDDQAPKDEVKALTAQAKALERFGNIPKAIEAWTLLADRYQGSPAATAALANVRRLRGK